MNGILNIIGVGAVTPLGIGAPQTCAAIRAGLTGFKVSYCFDRVRGPTLRAEIPIRPRPNDCRPIDRLVALAATALQECLLMAQLDARHCVLLLGVREAFRAAGDSAWSETALLDSIRSIEGLGFSSYSELIPYGNASAMFGLARARQLLSSGRITACIVGGVDSLHTLADTRIFGRDCRFKSDDIAQGFIPGEGAAFIAIEKFGSDHSLANILGLGLAQESTATTVLGASQPSGYGLEEAMRAALVDSRLSEADLSFRLSDMNGESYRTYETLLASSRFYRTRREHFPMTLAAASIGETGAAAGALTLVLAATALARRHSPGPYAICEASSDEGLRGACIVGAG